jgi:hypothetical protein
MANPTSYRPSELAYLLSYLSVNTVIGWGAGPFTPPKGGENGFWDDAIARLTEAKRLLPGKQPGRYRFSDDAMRVANTLADPQIVIATNRKDGERVQTLTHHVAGTNIIELSLDKDGNFQVVEYPTLGGPAGAAAAFASASPKLVATPVRIEATQDIFSKIKSLAKAGDASATGVLERLGASEAVTSSILSAFRAPAASGLISVMYCAGNAAQDTEVYSVLTSKAGESWVVFPPASINGPVVLENTSVSALAARILVTVSARMMLPV